MIRIDLDTDGAGGWTAVTPDLPDVLAHARTASEAVARLLALAPISLVERDDLEDSRHVRRLLGMPPRRPYPEGHRWAAAVAEPAEGAPEPGP